MPPRHTLQAVPSIGWNLSTPARHLRYGLPPRGPSTVLRDPDVVPPGEHLVYTENGAQMLSGKLHAPFRIDADGAALSLLDADGALADAVDFNESSPPRGHGAFGRSAANTPRPCQHAGDALLSSRRKKATVLPAALTASPGRPPHPTCAIHNSHRAGDRPDWPCLTDDESDGIVRAVHQRRILGPLQHPGRRASTPPPSARETRAGTRRARRTVSTSSRATTYSLRGEHFDSAHASAWPWSPICAASGVPNDEASTRARVGEMNADDWLELHRLSGAADLRGQRRHAQRQALSQPVCRRQVAITCLFDLDWGLDDGVTPTPPRRGGSTPTAWAPATPRTTRCSSP